MNRKYLGQVFKTFNIYFRFCILKQDLKYILRNDLNKTHPRMEYIFNGKKMIINEQRLIPFYHMTVYNKKLYDAFIKLKEEGSIAGFSDIRMK